ncbi:aldehyde dehydrogenase family protein [Nocardia sp. ET3-3]|uniref:Aldehyde dehydrogenase family protein n=1 Tax=Nocardia terrae TaxID=2675851 RepID=A0A7K1V287_9NOCA|nr:aldehyde dehydrogenase [Nocardia terrae]MVU80715.1 aldehyde dehydrogenase family protein [Nocardia terrae]
MEYVYGRLFIDGEWVTPASDRVIDVISAHSEQQIGQVPAGTPDDIDAAVTAARNAFEDPAGWAHWTAPQRAVILNRFADEIESRRDEFARRVSLQNGMPITIARRTEAAAPAALLRYYAELITQHSTEERRPSLLSGTTVVRREPIGVVAAIVPWNFPQCLTFFKLAPALAAGCAVVVKPAPETVLDAFLVAEAAAAAGLPAGILNIVTGGGEVGAHLVTHPGVDKVAFTGSTAAGKAIAEQCARLMRPATLELGGKSAGIILEDFDLSRATQALFGATLLNQGQTCYLSTRIFAPHNRYDEVVDAFTALAANLPIGDPLDRSTVIGPLATRRQRDTVESYIAKGVAEGGRITTGGGRPAGLPHGWYVEPTIFADVDNSATIAQEEIFGPVLSIIRYRDIDDAITQANDSAYGLGGTVWTADADRGLEVARRIHSGSVGINGFALDHGAPFGGVKNSGIGRELGPEGLAAYQQLKSIYLPA